MKRLIIAVMVCLVPMLAWANQRVYGDCSQGNYTVNVLGSVSSLAVGGATNGVGTVMASFPSCTVTVYNTGTQTLTTIYSDNSNTPKSNPFTASADGSWFFYANNTRVDVVLSGANFPPAGKTLGDVLLNDALGSQIGSNNTWTGTNTFTQLTTHNGGLNTTTVNNDIYTKLQAGADFCTRLTNAVAAATSGGDRIIGEDGAQTCTATVIVNKPVEIDFGAITLTGPVTGDIINTTVTGTKLIGCGKKCTVIKPQTVAQAHGIHGSTQGGTNYIVRDLTIQDSTAQSNPSLSTRTAGSGIFMEHNSSGVSSWGQIENVDVAYMYDGYNLDNPITTNVTGGWLTQNVEDGVHWVGGTSTNFTSTYGLGNGRYDWFISGVTYSSLNGTAADSAGVNHPTYPISSISSASNTITVTTSANTPVTAHQYVTIAGVGDSTFNGNYETASSNGTNQFVYSLIGGDRSSSGGTATTQGIGYFCNACVGVSFNGVGTEVSSGMGVELLNSNGITFNGRVLSAVSHGIVVEGSRDISLFGYDTANGTNGTDYGVDIISSAGSFGNNASSATGSLGVTNYGMALSDGLANITTISRAANVVTVQTATAHGLASNNMVNIAGVNTSTFNGWFKVATIIDPTHFTYNQNGGVQNDTTGRSERDVQVASSGIFQSFMENSFSGFGAIYTDQTIKASQQGLNLNLGGNSTGFIGLNKAQGTGSGGVQGGDGTGGAATWTVSSAGLGTFNGGLVLNASPTLSYNGSNFTVSTPQGWGSLANPFTAFVLGSGTNVSASIQGTFAANRVLTVPDPGGSASFAFTNPTTVQTLTGTTFDTAGANNTFKVAGTSISSVSGNTSKLASASGSYPLGNTVKADASGNLVDAGSPPFGFTSVNVTPVTVNTNTAADQNLQAITITAGVLNSIGKSLLIQTAGVYSTPAGSTSIVTLKAKLCTVSGCGSGTVITLASIASAALGAIQATNDPFNLTLNSSTQTAGASASFEAHGNLTIDISALTTAAEAVYADGNTTTVGTIDSTAPLFLQITGSFSNASGSNTMTERQLIADVVD